MPHRTVHLLKPEFDLYAFADQYQGEKFVPGKTLSFFDEITEFPEITTFLKFFCIDGRFDVICSGSMLGVNYKRMESNSAGYKKDYEMYSMGFEEFLWAKGYDNDNECLPFYLSGLYYSWRDACGCERIYRAKYL